MSVERTGFLLLNLGTPGQPTTREVAKYLRQFLSDPFVIDIPGILRWPLVNAWIVPFRAPQSARAYQSIWMPEGSPLLVHTRELAQKVQAEVPTGIEVDFAMRYGEPSVSRVLERWKKLNLKKILILPLYPQFALSSTRTGLQWIKHWLRELKFNAEVFYLQDFFNYSGFVQGVANKIKIEQEQFKPDHLLLSYHGLPVRHLTALAPAGSLCSQILNCCETMDGLNSRCYRAQCFSTSRWLGKELGLLGQDYTVAFQSRLGRSEWIKPYTDHMLVELAQKGVRRLLVACPSFVADCLETLEEVALRGRNDFKAAGGEDLRLVPCLNSDKSWAESVAKMLDSKEVRWQALEY